MRQVAVTGARPASRARARSPAAPSTRQSQAAAYGFQSPQQRGSGGSGPGASAAGVSVASTRNECTVVPSSAASAARPSQARGSGVTASVATESRASRSARLAVVVRKRPMNRREVQAQQQDVVLCRNNQVIVREPKLKVDLTRYVEEHNFLFDQSFDETVTNEGLYNACVRPLIDAVFTRGKCTCFAYGQTGSGKTFTMMGPPKAQREMPGGDRTPGIFLLASQDMFRYLSRQEHSNLRIYIAFYEIYCGKLFDLLNNRQILHARENAKQNVVIVGLQEHLVENVQELMEVIEFGLNSRTTGVTGANVDSSRSHAILQISLKDTRSKEDGKAKEHGKVSFIDLAGSERGADTLDTDRQTRMDGAEINKSLLALKECIRALDQQLDHTPFRGSKLTQVLKDSFIGSNCRTVMIANVSPCSQSVEHSLNTLRYAYRVKELRRASSTVTGNVDTGSLQEMAGMSGHGDMNMEEEFSDDASDVDDTPADVQQQMRVANLSAAAQTLASPRRPPERVVGIAGSDQRVFEPAPRVQQVPQQPEEVSVAPRYTSAAQAGQGNVVYVQAGPEAVPHEAEDPAQLHMARMEVVGGQHQNVMAHHQQQQQELAPEVAVEPGGCSQAALDELARQHDRLIGTILAEEEELITAHRQHIDMMVELIKEEMVHLNNVDRPGSDVDAYVAGIDRILRLKAQYIGDIRQRVDCFKEHLQQEDTLSRKFQSLASSSA